MPAKQKVVNDIIVYLENVLEVPREEFGGLPACPFAKAERVSKNLLIDIFDPGKDDFVSTVKQMESDGYRSGLFALFQDQIPVEISESDTKKLQVFFNKTLRLSGNKKYKTICFNPNDKQDVGGFNPRSFAPYFLVNVAEREILNKAHKDLTRTKYFDNLHEKYRRFLKL